MKRVLVTGGSHAELPLIRVLKEEGWYVITTGTNEDGLGHKAADEYIRGDFSDREFVLALAKEKEADAMVSGCNDFAYLSTAYACEKLGLPGHDSYDTALIVHHKNEFRKLTKRLGIRTPWFSKCRTEKELEAALAEMSFPVVIKPVDLTGGKGVHICGSKNEAVSAFREAMGKTRESYVIAEEFIRGTNHGASFLLSGQKVVFSFFDNEQYFKNPYLVGGACTPSDVPQYAMQQLITDVEKTAGALMLTDGLFHVQFIMDEGKGPVMIDPCRRTPGDLYVLLVKYAAGVDYPAAIVHSETGDGPGIIPDVSLRPVARECIMADQPGQIREIRIRDNIKQFIVDRMIWGKEGDTVDDTMTYKAGILFLEFRDYHQMMNVLSCFPEMAGVVTVQEGDQ